MCIIEAVTGWPRFREAVRHVYQLEYFPAIVPAGHTQLRIEYNKPVRLIGHSSHNRARWTRYTTILSAEPSLGAVTAMTCLEGHKTLCHRIAGDQPAARYDSMIAGDAMLNNGGSS